MARPRVAHPAGDQCTRTTGRVSASFRESAGIEDRVGVPAPSASPLTGPITGLVLRTSLRIFPGAGDRRSSSCLACTVDDVGGDPAAGEAADARGRCCSSAGSRLCPVCAR